LIAVLTLTAFVLGVLGGGLAFAPRTMAHLYGTAVSIDGTNAGRTAGAAILALALLAWMSRRDVKEGKHTVGVTVLFVWFALKSVVAYVAVVDGVFHPVVGKMILFLDILLASIYGKLVFEEVLASRRTRIPYVKNCSLYTCDRIQR
jgi:hypothetical protein